MVVIIWPKILLDKEENLPHKTIFSVPYAKKIKLYSKRGTLFEKLYRVIEFEKKKNECLKELYEDKTSGDL